MQNGWFDMDEEEAEMYLEVDWLAPSDRYILEYMDSARKPDGEASELTPKVIARNTSVARKHAGARCRELADRGLVEKTDRGVYRITQLGEEFVAGELSVEDLREL